MDGDVQALRDELLVLRCQQGDRRAITSLIAAWEARLFYYVRRLTPQERTPGTSSKRPGCRWSRTSAGFGFLALDRPIGRKSLFQSRFVWVD